MANALQPRTLTGLALPLAVWALHFVAVYSLQGLACAEGWQRLRLAGIEATTIVMAWLTLAALALVAWLAMRAWRTARAAGSIVMRTPADERRGFIARTTVLSSLIAAVAVLFTGLPLLMLRTCA